MSYLHVCNVRRYIYHIFTIHIPIWSHLKICEGQASRAWDEICKHTCWQTSTRRRPESRRVSSDSHGKLPRYAKTQWPCYATHLAMAQQWWNITRQVNFHSLLSCSGGCRKVQVLGSCEKPSLMNAIIKNRWLSLSSTCWAHRAPCKTCCSRPGRPATTCVKQQKLTSQSEGTATLCHSRICIPLWGPKSEASWTHQKSSLLCLDCYRDVQYIC